jgi:aspartyl/asparaginyl-tRNA synthetase
VVHATLSHIFNGLEERFHAELAAVRSQYPSEPVRLSDEPCIIHWEDAMEMLKVSEGHTRAGVRWPWPLTRIRFHRAPHGVPNAWWRRRSAPRVRRARIASDATAPFHSCDHKWERRPIAPRACTRSARFAHARSQVAGEEADVRADLTTALERRLGELVAEKHGVDLYILDRFPAAARPFYTMPCADNPELTNSYDVFLRGEEICSGAQRVHVPELLEERIKAQGLPPDSLQWYVDSMKYGTPPHAGAGLGLDRVVFLYLALDNVRQATMFPRDPNRLSP